MPCHSHGRSIVYGWPALHMGGSEHISYPVLIQEVIPQMRRKGAF